VQAAAPGEKAKSGTGRQKALRVVEGAVFDETATEAVLALSRYGVQSPARGRDRERQRQGRRPAPGRTSRGVEGAPLGGPLIEVQQVRAGWAARETGVIAGHAEARGSSSNEASARPVRGSGNRAIRRVLVAVVDCRSWVDASSPRGEAGRKARGAARGSLARRSIADERGPIRDG
jgi:hypothetical protein